MPSPLVVGGAIAAATTQIPITVAAVVAPLWDPIRLAEDLATLDNLAGRGRLIVTFVIGYRELEFELLGYGYRHLQTAPATALTKVHGQYREADLPALLQRVAPDLVWFPAQWPETYSYTLSAALAAGLPVAVPDLGAFVERVADRPWSWVEPWDSSAQGWLDFFLRIRAQCFVAGHAPQAGPLPDALAALHASHPAWDYRADYLAFAHADASAQAVANAPAVARLVAAQQPVPPALAAGAGGAYALALKLQQLPVLGGLARRIPSSWRYRVKQLLSR